MEWQERERHAILAALRDHPGPPGIGRCAADLADILKEKEAQSDSRLVSSYMHGLAAKGWVEVHRGGTPLFYELTLAGRRHLEEA
jgi:DNA-binding transcriptional ArsR family regulator